MCIDSIKMNFYFVNKAKFLLIRNNVFTDLTKQ